MKPEIPALMNSKKFVFRKLLIDKKSKTQAETIVNTPAIFFSRDSEIFLKNSISDKYKESDKYKKENNQEIDRYLQVAIAGIASGFLHFFSIYFMVRCIKEDQPTGLFTAIYFFILGIICLDKTIKVFKQGSHNE